jgi:hypothetical protein
MAVFSGPEIVNDGLVFYYDIDNQKKSWKGKPTTNLHTNTSTFSGWTLNAATIDTIDNVARLTETGTTSGPFMLQDSSLTNGVVYSESIDAMADLRYVLQIAPSTGFSNNTLYTNFNLVNGTMTGTGTAKSTMTYLGDDWYRCTYTETASSTSAGRMVYGIAINPESTRLESAPRIDGYGIFVNQSQLEVNSFATPFVNGTRSNTQAILDLTNNNTVTATSLTYASNNTFSFNGIDNSITISNGISYASGFTLAAWINPQSIGGGTFGRIFDKTPALGTTSGFAFYLSGTNQLNFSVNNIGTLTTASSTISLDNWQYVVATVTSAGAAAIYINAVSRASGTTGATSGITTTNLLTVGNRSGATDRTFDGDIDVASLYNRALTAQEIAQNFEAMRDRYDI